MSAVTNKRILPEEPTKVTTPPPRIDVIDLTTREVIHSVPLTNTSERYIERVMRGMLRNLREGLVLEEVLK